MDDLKFMDEALALAREAAAEGEKKPEPAKELA